MSRKLFFFIIFISNCLSFYADNVDSLNNILKNIEEPKDKATIYNKLANEFIGYDNKKVYDYADSALLIGLEINNKYIIANAYTNKANSFFYAGDLDSVLFYYDLSYKEILQTNDEDEIAASLNRLGLIYESKCEFKTASQYYLDALEIYEKTNNSKGIADVYNNLGIINDHMQKFDVSIDYYRKSYNIYKKIKNQEGQAKTLNNIATVYNDLNQLDTALIYFKKALDILILNNNKTEIAVAMNNIGNLFFRKENIDSALYYLNTALKIDIKIGYKPGIASGYEDIAKIELKIGDIDKALNFLHKALKIRYEVGNTLSIANTMHIISEAYKQKQIFDSAFYFFSRYNELKDSIINQEMELKISELQLKYTSEKKDKEIQLLKKDAQINSNLKILLLIIISALIVISFLALYLLKIKSKLLEKNKLLMQQQEEISNLAEQKHIAEKKLLSEEVAKQQEINKLQQEKFDFEIQHKNRELITSTMHLLNKNKMLAEIQKNLDDLIANAELQSQKIIKQINKQIVSNINLDSDWETFKKHFEAVNVNFFENLQQKYPDLTKGDLKICSYLKINLTSKEIAQMLNISLSGVNKKIYRLRKKFGIDSNTSITIFLMDF